MNKELTTEQWKAIAEKLAEKDAMIDWLARKLAISLQACPYKIYKQSDCDESAIQCWRKAAQEAVGKNDQQ